MIEIGVVRGRVDTPPRRWSTLVFPDRPVAATHVHGLTDGDVSGAPRFATVVPELREALDGAVMVAHNAAFDTRFLAMELERAGLPPLVGPVLDTLGLSRRHLGLPSHSLTALCERFAIPRPRAHRALADAQATWQLAWVLLGVVDPERELEVEAAIERCRRRTAEEHLALRHLLLDAQQRGVTLLVDYHAADRTDEVRTRRVITVRKVFARKLVAWCHLRGAERTFRIDRLRLVSSDTRGTENLQVGGGND